VNPLTRPIPLRLWYLLAIVFAGVLILAVAGAIYTQHAVSREGHKLCQVFTLLDGTYHQTPPSTAAGRAFASAIHQTVLDLGC